MPNGSFDVSYAHSYKELAEGQRSPGDAARISQLKFHLETRDYFAFLATVFGILEDGLSGKPAETAEELALVRSIRKDLVYLQQEYRIEPVPIEA